MADTREERALKIERMRISLQAHPALLERFNDIHPLQRTPTTLQQALTETAQNAEEAVDIQPVGGWYGWRQVMQLTCSEEFRHEKGLHRFM